jgi:hypothetical protein
MSKETSVGHVPALITLTVTGNALHALKDAESAVPVVNDEPICSNTTPLTSIENSKPFQPSPKESNILTVKSHC